VTAEPSDEVLVRAARTGDRRAFSALYRRHCGGVARALASYAGPDRTAVDDLTQDVFLRVIQSLDRYTPHRPFTHWLYTIALNVGRNHVRGRSRIMPLDGVAEPALGTSAGMAEALLREAALREAARLPEGLREVLALRIGGDLPFAAIAELLEIPEGTARRRMHEALRSLRIALEAASRKERA